MSITYIHTEPILEVLADLKRSVQNISFKSYINFTDKGTEDTS